MLKIKDNVDLKELEKYGFEKGFSPMDNRFVFLFVDNEKILNVTCNTPWWDMNYYYAYNSNVNTLYDLIQDGLVEKVED